MEKEGRLSKLTILVADDSSDYKEIIQEILSLNGAKVEFARNGEEAVKLALSKNFDVILMDEKMPFMTGTEASKKIKSTKKIPIIRISGSGKDSDGPFDGLLEKPFKESILLDVIEKCLADKKL